MAHSSHLLSAILFTPLLGAVTLLFVPREATLLHRVIGNFFGVLGFVVSLPTCPTRYPCSTSNSDDK